MSSPALILKKPVLSGTTQFLDLFIHPPNSPQGFKPETLTMSVYDVRWPNVTQCPRRYGDAIVFPEGATHAIVNDRNDVDVLDMCDAEGNAEIELTPEDTTVDVPVGPTPSVVWRYILFTATWDGSPAKVTKTQAAISIIPDRESLAT